MCCERAASRVHVGVVAGGSTDRPNDTTEAGGEEEERRKPAKTGSRSHGQTLHDRPAPPPTDTPPPARPALLSMATSSTDHTSVHSRTHSLWARVPGTTVVWDGGPHAPWMRPWRARAGQPGKEPRASHAPASSTTSTLGCHGTEGIQVKIKGTPGGRKQKATDRRQRFTVTSREGRYGGMFGTDRLQTKGMGVQRRPPVGVGRPGVLSTGDLKCSSG